MPRSSSISTRNPSSARSSQPGPRRVARRARRLETGSALEEDEERLVATVGLGDLAREHRDRLPVGPRVVERSGELVLRQDEPGRVNGRRDGFDPSHGVASPPMPFHRLALVAAVAVALLAAACDASARTPSAVDRLSLSQLAGQRSIYSYSGKLPPPAAVREDPLGPGRRDHPLRPEHLEPRADPRRDRELPARAAAVAPAARDPAPAAADHDRPGGRDRQAPARPARAVRADLHRGGPLPPP